MLGARDTEVNKTFRELKLGLGNNLEGWDGRDVRARGDMGKRMADSC